MNERTNERTNERMNERKNEGTNERTTAGIVCGENTFEKQTNSVIGGTVGLGVDNNSTPSPLALAHLKWRFFVYTVAISTHLVIFLNAVYCTLCLLFSMLALNSVLSE